jgi:hypothetical protein
LENDNTPTAGDNRLPELAHAITAALESHRKHAFEAAEYALETGKLLAEAKLLVKHGQWANWLRDNFSLSERSAQRYMQLFKSGLKAPQVADLGIRRAAEAIAEKHDKSEREHYGFMLYDRDSNRGKDSPNAFLIESERNPGFWHLFMIAGANFTHTDRPMTQDCAITAWAQEIVTGNHHLSNFECRPLERVHIEDLATMLQLEIA